MGKWSRAISCVLRTAAIWFGMTAACSSSSSQSTSSAVADHRDDPACADAGITSNGSSCTLAASVHEHQYSLACDLSRGSCTCWLDGTKTNDDFAFASPMPMCTLADRKYEWQPCCGEPR
jgi:hypothetical protein